MSLISSALHSRSLALTPSPPSLPPLLPASPPNSLPKTRSGKIMRRILRKTACRESDSLGDTSTLADPSIVQILIDKVEGQYKAAAKK